METHADADLDREWYRLLVAQLRAASNRAAAAERRTRQLENAVKGIAREVGTCSLGPPCGDCEESLLLVAEGTLRCPRCGHRQTL